MLTLHVLCKMRIKPSWDSDVPARGPHLAVDSFIASLKDKGVCTDCYYPEAASGSWRSGTPGSAPARVGNGEVLQVCGSRPKRGRVGRAAPGPCTVSLPRPGPGNPWERRASRVHEAWDLSPAPFSGLELVCTT